MSTDEKKGVASKYPQPLQVPDYFRLLGRSHYVIQHSIPLELFTSKLVSCFAESQLLHLLRHMPTLTPSQSHCESPRRCFLVSSLLLSLPSYIYRAPLLLSLFYILFNPTQFYPSFNPQTNRQVNILTQSHGIV